jgi:hypothetical protein
MAVVKIKDLSVFRGGTTICARIISKDVPIPTRTGSLFHIVLMDAPHATIRATVFDKDGSFDEQLECHHTYKFIGGSLAEADPLYNTCYSNLALVYSDRKASFVHIPEDEANEMNDLEAVNVADDDIELVFVLISSLKLEKGQQNVKACIITRNATHNFDNTSVFSFDMDDDSGLTIRGVCFGEAAEKFHDLIKLGNTYTFVGGGLRSSEHKWDDCTSELEFRFEAHAEITLCDGT